MYCADLNCWQLASQCWAHGVGSEEFFRAQFQGLLLKRGEDDAEGIRKPTFNLARNADPLWWAVVKNEQDIQLAVRFAGAKKFKVAVCSAGQHSWHSQSDDMLIDLRNLKGVGVDTEQQLVRFKMGHTLGEIDEITHASGQLHVPLGVVSHTGTGLALGGGVGMLTRLYGATADNIVAGKVVLASGELVDANEEKNPDLLLSLRGGAGLTGVVTEVTARAYKVDQVWAKVQALFLEQATGQYGKLAAFYQRPEVAAEKRATSYFIFGFSPEGLRCFLVVNVFLGPEEEAKTFFGGLELDNIGVVFEGCLPFPALQKMHDGGFGPAVWYATGLSLADPIFSEALFQEVAEVWKNDTAAEVGGFVLEQRGGAWCTNASNTLLGTRDANWDLVIFPGFKTLEGKEAKIDAFREYKQRFKTVCPSLREVKLPNFQMKDKISGSENETELARLKKKFDPTGLFCNLFGL